MKTIFTACINNTTLRFTSKGLDLDPYHDLNNLSVRETYIFGQVLHPIILQLRKASGKTPMEEIRNIVQGLPAGYQNAAWSILRRANHEFYERRFQLSYVYLVKNNQDLYKIGRTKELARRMKRFDVKLPFPVETIVLIETCDPAAEEKLWHTRFADKRIDGEWFALDDADVQWMKQHDARYTAPPDDEEVTPNPTSHLWEFGDRSNG